MFQWENYLVHYHDCNFPKCTCLPRVWNANKTIGNFNHKEKTAWEQVQWCIYTTECWFSLNKAVVFWFVKHSHGKDITSAAHNGWGNQCNRPELLTVANWQPRQTALNCIVLLTAHEQFNNYIALKTVLYKNTYTLYFFMSLCCLKK